MQMEQTRYRDVRGPRGRIERVRYQATNIKGVTMEKCANVYLPAGYNRAKTYPLVLVSHGGGGNEADWPVQGSIGSVMDNLIAQGKTKEAILVCMNNSVYSWDYAKIARNCEEKIIPFVEKLFSVSRSAAESNACSPISVTPAA